MSGNTFGRIFRLTTFGESHGTGIGGVIDGCPSGISLNVQNIQQELNRRRPGQSKTTSQRREQDKLEILSGVYSGYSTGTPIAFFVYNQDQISQDYEHLKDIYRPGHADYTYEAKYGIRDYRGGGRASARETLSRVAGGAIAQQVLKAHGIHVYAYTREIGGIEAEIISFEQAQSQAFFAPDPSVVQLWKKKIQEVSKNGDSLGGLVEIQALGVPPGLGEPVFDKLDARLAYALMGVGAVKSVEIGRGKEAAQLLGSQNNDPIGKKGFTSNNAGGILGGISSGQPVVLRAAVKPIPSITQPQQTINTRGEEVSLQISGRHDVCAIPRIVPVLKAMVNLVLTDMLLLHRSNKI